MSIKKKLSLGIATGALSLSLIGGGAYAAFNDVEEFQNTFAAGTLDLELGEENLVNLNISNLKPGDYFTRTLTLDNNGSLDINQIFVKANKLAGWTDLDEIDLETKIGAGAGSNTEDEFLSQFQVDIAPSGGGAPIVSTTLNNVVAALSPAEITGTNASTVGLATGGGAAYDITVTFVEDPTTFPGSRLHEQNKYQGEQTNLEFVFEATQMPGEERSND